MLENAISEIRSPESSAPESTPWWWRERSWISLSA